MCLLWFPTFKHLSDGDPQIPQTNNIESTESNIIILIDRYFYANFDSLLDKKKTNASPLIDIPIFQLIY